MKPITFADFDFNKFSLSRRNLHNGEYIIIAKNMYNTLSPSATFHFNGKDELHNELAAAFSSYYYYLKIGKNNKITLDSDVALTFFNLWVRHGIIHREDGPAFILKYSTFPRYNKIKYYLEGKLIPKYEYFKIYQPDKWEESFNKTISFQGKKYRFYSFGPDGKIILEKI